MESYFRLCISEWKVSMDAIGMTLLDSQDIDYNVKLQKDKQDYDCRKTIAPIGAYCNETQPSLYWEKAKEDSEGLGLFLVLE
jgi:hypothetical protein